MNIYEKINNGRTAQTGAERMSTLDKMVTILNRFENAVNQSGNNTSVEVDVHALELLIVGVKEMMAYKPEVISQERYRQMKLKLARRWKQVESLEKLVEKLAGPNKTATVSYQMKNRPKLKVAR
jgi:predicted enzyme involved in methoxymalonyl-ACP biosynthesis